MVQVFAQKVMGIDLGQLQSTISPILRSHRVSSAEVSFQKEPAGWVLRITVESLDGPSGAPLDEPIDLGLLADVSRDVSAALDVADFIPHAYHLEVSSPGLDRPLRAARDYERAVGKTVKLHLSRPAPDGQKVLRGRLIASDEASATVEVDGKPIRTELALVERANLIFELPTQPKKGRQKPAKTPRH
jgi:ribosome maturation factor RimP